MGFEGCCSEPRSIVVWSRETSFSPKIGEKTVRVGHFVTVAAVAAVAARQRNLVPFRDPVVFHEPISESKSRLSHRKLLQNLLYKK
jgi:hypothetical protein